MKTSFFPNDFQFDDNKDARVVYISSAIKEYGFKNYFLKNSTGRKCVAQTPCHVVAFKVKIFFLNDFQFDDDKENV